jgi:hypothetical protein
MVDFAWAQRHMNECNQCIVRPAVAISNNERLKPRIGKFSRFQDGLIENR